MFLFQIDIICLYVSGCPELEFGVTVPVVPLEPRPATTGHTSLLLQPRLLASFEPNTSLKGAHPEPPPHHQSAAEVTEEDDIHSQQHSSNDASLGCPTITISGDKYAQNADSVRLHKGFDRKDGDNMCRQLDEEEDNSIEEQTCVACQLEKSRMTVEELNSPDTDISREISCDSPASDTMLMV